MSLDFDVCNGIAVFFYFCFSTMILFDLLLNFSDADVYSVITFSFVFYIVMVKKENRAILESR